jgi:riboflavin biosynthesis pyrimidine reductase
MAVNPVRYRCLLPPGDDAEHDIDGLLDAMFAALSPPRDRPYTLANFVTSADGRATVKGGSSALGDDGDKAIFHCLRERVDAVLAGTTTMRVENYGRMLGSAERRERRRDRGISPEPLACTLTRSGNVPTDAPLFSAPEARVVVFGPESMRGALDGSAAQVELVTLDADALNWSTALSRLRDDFEVQTLLCEGGPSVFGALLGAGLVDELFLTLAPRLVGGGDGPAITRGPELPELAALSYRWLLERDQTLYARFAVNS